MSAFLVGNDHLNALVNLALYGPSGREVRPDKVWHALRERNREAAQELGELLAGENLASVNHRYREHNESVPFIWLPNRARPTALEGLKAIACYEYQACEHPGWEASEARAFCEDLRRRLVACLEGYDHARGWEWRDTPALEGR